MSLSTYYLVFCYHLALVHCHRCHCAYAPMSTTASHGRRCFQRRCVHVYKCLNELINHELTLETQQHQHNYNTRNKINLRLPCVKRKWGKQRTAYHAVNDFNSLSEMIRDSANVNIFKRQVYIFLI